MSIELSAAEIDALRAKKREDEQVKLHTMDMEEIELKAHKMRIHEELQKQRKARTVPIRFNPPLP